jgi:large subunit ribosomal protein L18
MRKNETRLRRARKTRFRIRELGVHRLTVHRTPQHIYAQIITPDGSAVVAAASTLQEPVRSKASEGDKKAAAAAVGREIAGKAKTAGITKVAFDRSGFRFHGRVRALADAAREGGLEF